MRLKDNQMAPLFSQKAFSGEVYDLSVKREKPLLLAFFRYASCPLCNFRVHELIQNHQRLNKHLEIVAIFQSPKNKVEQYVCKQDIPFTLIPDPDKNLYKQYAVESSWFGFGKAWTVKISQVFNAVIKHRFIPGTMEGEIHRIPADFIIDTDGKILKAFYGQHIGDHLPLNEIEKLIGIHETG